MELSDLLYHAVFCYSCWLFSYKYWYSDNKKSCNVCIL